MHDIFRRARALWQSFAAKLTLLLAIFGAVPIVLYTQFETADADKNALLHRSVQEEGRLIAEALKPLLERFQGRSADRLSDALTQIGGARINVKLLFQPKGVAGPDSFFYIAASPAVPAEYLEKERADLVHAGILEKLKDTCTGNRPLALRYTNPAGAEEILSSITPVNLRSGCWIVITSHATAEFLSSSFGRPYWKTPEVRIAATIYILLAIVVLSLFGDVWRNLRRFERLAHDIRTERTHGESFRALNRIPELDRVAGEFDQLVDALRQSAETIRQIAEENAHALKAPLAVIAQSIEPLRRCVPAGDGRTRRAIELIERSIARLDALVSVTRRLERTTAELIDPPRGVVDLSLLLQGMLEDYRDTTRARGFVMSTDIEPDIRVRGGEDLFETVVENLIENALSFSPPGGVIAVALHAQGPSAALAVEDQGPGVPPENLGRIFERYFSYRPAPPGGGGEGGGSESAASAPGGNFGIGLWIVRRNVEAVGGTVATHNKGDGGLKVTITLPYAG